MTPTIDQVDQAYHELVSGRSLIENESGWTRFNLKKDGQHCARGALMEVAGVPCLNLEIDSFAKGHLSDQFMAKAAFDLFPDDPSFREYLDNGGSEDFLAMDAHAWINRSHCHADVLRLFDRAIALVDEALMSVRLSVDAPVDILV